MILYIWLLFLAIVQVGFLIINTSNWVNGIALGMILGLGLAHYMENKK